MVNGLSADSLLAVVAEWLERPAPEGMIRRDPPAGMPDLRRASSIAAVVGPRRAGKTFFMFQLVGDLRGGAGRSRRDVLFADFEDFRLRGFSAEDVDRLLGAFNQLTGRQPAYLFFDEVQQVRDWSRMLRTLHNRGRFRIVVSGSNSKLLSRDVATELRGRYLDVLILPFSLRECLRFHGVEADPVRAHTPSRGGILRALDEYLRFGGYPEVVKASGPLEKRQILQTYYRTIFYRDAVDRFSIKATHMLEELMGYLLETNAELFSISGFEKILKASGQPGSKRTLANYLRNLQEVFFIVANAKFSFSPRKRIMNPKKTYLMDPGFARLGSEFLESRGKSLEDAVAIELLRSRREAWYFAGKGECDFITMDLRGERQAVQVCWELSPRNEKRELGGLEEAMREARARSGVIVTLDQEGTRRVGGRPVNVIPFWRWTA